MADERLIPLHESNRVQRRARNFVSSEINTKAMPTIGRQGAIEQATFDPNAEDGDGDGLVQDNTPFERPALLKPLTDAMRGLASATGSSGQQWSIGKTNREVAEHAFRATTPDELRREIMAEVASTGGGSLSPEQNATIATRKIDTALEVASFEPEDIQSGIDALEKALDESPLFRELVDTFGIPPMYVMSKDDSMLGLFLPGAPSIGMHTNKNLYTRGSLYAFDGVHKTNVLKLDEHLPVPGTRRFSVGKTQQENIYHEYGHYIASLGWQSHPDGEKRAAFFALSSLSWTDKLSDDVKSPELDGLRKLFDYAKKFADGRRGEDWIDFKLDKPDEDMPMVESAYGLTRPTEFWAEAFSSYLSPDEETRKLINEPMRELIRALLPGSTILGDGDGYKPSRTTGNTLSWMTPSQIADAVVPKTPDEARRLLVGHWRQLATDEQRKYSDEKILGIIERELKKYFGEGATIESVYAFDYGSQQRLREMVEKSLSEMPDFLESVRRFGMPPIMTTRQEVQKQWGRKSQGVKATAMADHLPMIMINPEAHEAWLNGEREEREPNAGLIERLFNRTFGFRGIENTGNRVIVDPSPEGILAHEWGHYIAKLAAYGHPDADVRELGRFYFAETWKDALDMEPSFGGTLERRMSGIESLMRAIKRSGKPTGDDPFVLTRYGQTSPAETFAEGVAAIFSRDKKNADLVSPALRQDIHRILGKERPEPAEDVLPQAEDRSDERGMASFSPVRRKPSDPDERAFKDNTGPLRDGPSWLKDATNEEIADAIVPRSLEDAIVLTTQHIMYGKNPDNKATTRAVKAFVGWYMTYGPGKTRYDFSPETQAKLRSITKQALDESPEFAWVVRQYGMPPVMAISSHSPQQIAGGMPTPPGHNGEINPMYGNPSIMGLTLGNMFVIMNPNSPSIKDDAPSGFIPDGSPHSTGRMKIRNRLTGDRDVFLPNMGKSGADVLRHEYAHWLWGSLVGTPAMYGGKETSVARLINRELGGPTLPWQERTRGRQDRADWYAAGTGRSSSEILSSSEYAKEAFDGSRMYWSSDPKTFNQMLARLVTADVLSYNSTTGQFQPGPKAINPLTGQVPPSVMAVVNEINNATIMVPNIQDGTFLFAIRDWTPAYASVMTRGLETMLSDVGMPKEKFGVPELSGAYAGTNPQEMFAEGFTIFTSPDSDLKNRYLSDEITAGIAVVLGLEISGTQNENERVQGRAPVGGVSIVNPPWGTERGMASRIPSRRDVLATVTKRSETLVDRHSGNRRILSERPSASIRRRDGGNFSISTPDGREFTTQMGQEPREMFRDAYRSWVSSSGHTPTRDASAEIMGMPQIESRIKPSYEDYVNAVALMDDVANSGNFSEYPGYRIIHSAIKDDALLTTGVGESIDLPLTSFNPDDTIARLTTRESTPKANSKTVIMRLSSGARVSEPGSSYDATISLPDGSLVDGRAEMITQGRFKVTGRKEEDNGIVVVDIEHVSTFNPLSRELISNPENQTLGVRPSREKDYAERSQEEERGMASRRGAKKTTKTFSDVDKPRPRPNSNSEIIARAIPKTPEELARVIKDSPYSKGKSFKKTMKMIDEMGIDWEGQEMLAIKLGNILAREPGLAELLSEYDIPPILVTGRGADFYTISSFSRSAEWMGTMGEYFPGMGVIGFRPEVSRQDYVSLAGESWSSDHTIIHEISHTIHAMAANRSKKAKNALIKDTARVMREMRDGGDGRLSGDEGEEASKLSRYATKNRLEYIAEALSHLFSASSSDRSRVTEQHLEMLSEYLDIPVEELRRLSRMSSSQSAMDLFR